MSRLLSIKWQHSDQEHWFKGTVLTAYGDFNFTICKFEVKYLNEENAVTMDLFKDLENRDLVTFWIVTGLLCVDTNVW